MDPLFSDLNELSRMTSKKAEKNLRECVVYLRNDFNGICKILRLYHPLEALKLAVWEKRKILKTKNDMLSKSQAELLPVLLQSIVQSSIFDSTDGISHNRDIKQKDWKRVVELSFDVARKILRYIDCLIVYQIGESKIKECDAEKYRIALYKLFFPSEEEFKTIDDLSYLLIASISDKKDEIEDSFHLPADKLISEMKNIALNSLDGIDMLTADSQIYKAEMSLEMAKKREIEKYREMSDDDLRNAIVKEKGWEGRLANIIGRRDDFDLFRPDFYSSLSRESYVEMSSELSKMDLYKCLENGVWPATVKPFISFGDFTFSFVSEHLMSFASTIIGDKVDLSGYISKAVEKSCLELFNPTDAVDVFSFDGHKIDLIAPPSLDELNPISEAHVFSSRIELRDEEMRKKSNHGHSELIIDSDSKEDFKSLGDNRFIISGCYICKCATLPEYSSEIKRRLFGQLEIIDNSDGEIYTCLDDEVMSPSEEADDDIADDNISDEYEYSDSEDEEEKKISERENALEDAPLDFENGVKTDISKLKERYALTDSIIQKENEDGEYFGSFERDLDDDDFDDEDDDADDFDDEDDKEEEALYDEAEQEDEYASDSADSSDRDDSEETQDQLDFLSILDDESPEEKELTDELIENDERDELEKEREEESFPDNIQKEEPQENVNPEPCTDQDQTEDSEKESDIGFPELSEASEDEESDDNPDDEIKQESLEDCPNQSKVMSESNGIEIVQDSDGVFVMRGSNDHIDDDFGLKGILKDIKRVLADNNSVYVSFVKNADADLRDYLSSVIKKSWEKQQQDHKDKVFTIYDYSLTVLLPGSLVRDELKLSELLDNAGAVMYSKKKKEWNALIVYIDEAYSVVDAEEKFITQDSFSSYDWKRVQIIGEQLLNRGQ